MEQVSKNKGKYILIGFGVVAIAGTAIYFATRTKKQTPEKPIQFDPSIPLPSVTTSTSNSSSGSSPRSNSSFPLKKGSKGDLVKHIQEALIQKYGSAILPKYGADGSWGSELQTALISKGLPTTITADIFTTIITSTGANTSSNPQVTTTSIATKLRHAILDNDFASALSALSKIKTVNGYTAVNTEFKKDRINGVRKTIVNALLTQFRDTTEKKKLNTQFYNIGLKYNGNQWSLSGIKTISSQIKSVCESEVWNNEGRSIIVPKDTILGELLECVRNVAIFRTLDNKMLFIKKNSICYV